MQSSEVSKLFNISIDTLRYYERIGIIPPVSRDKNGYRDYQTTDLNWIFFSKTLRETGMSIESLVEFVSLVKTPDEVGQAQKQVLADQLAEINQKIKRLTESRDLLQVKINTFDEHLAKFKGGQLSLVNPDEKMWLVDWSKRLEK